MRISTPSMTCRPPNSSGSTASQARAAASTARRVSLGLVSRFGFDLEAAEVVDTDPDVIEDLLDGFPMDEPSDSERDDAGQVDVGDGSGPASADREDPNAGELEGAQDDNGEQFDTDLDLDVEDELSVYLQEGKCILWFRRVLGLWCWAYGRREDVRLRVHVVSFSSEPLAANVIPARSQHLSLTSLPLKRRPHGRPKT